MLEQPCPTCGYEMDINADVCPQCGQARRRQREPHTSGGAAAAYIGGGMLAGGLLGWIIGVAGAGDSYGAEVAISGFMLLGVLVGLLAGIVFYRRYSRRQ